MTFKVSGRGRGLSDYTSTVQIRDSNFFGVGVVFDEESIGDGLHAQKDLLFYEQ